MTIIQAVCFEAADWASFWELMAKALTLFEKPKRAETARR
jgi:hypothetical protein